MLALNVPRTLISRVARKHGMRVSLSPKPFADGVGCGAHQHFSLWRGETPLLSGGDGEHGLTAHGAAAIAGVVSGLVDAQLVLCGSIVSGLRMQPGSWAGCYTCWGTENREAAVRFIPATRGTGYGANAEVKIVDPSANPYLATAAILGLAIDGIENTAMLPPEVTVDPQLLTDTERRRVGAIQLGAEQPNVIAALDHSSQLRTILGDSIIDALIAVRRYEQQNYADLDAGALADKFRMAWSL
jgi:glutamine synthetase